MKWAWKIGRWAGIDVYIHVTFVVLLAALAFVNWLGSGSLTAALYATLFPALIFLCVLLHEFGHALAAKRFGIPTRDITLYPIGGVARLERMPEKPAQELVVALAGPMVNVIIAAALYFFLANTRGFQPVETLTLSSGSLLQRLMIANMMLVGFNLLPAFPMDGGRVLRALLASLLDYVRATHIAASIGQAMALLFAFVGITGGNPFLLFIAFFVWIGASQESSMVQIKTALAGIPVWRAMITDFRALTPQDSLAAAADLIIAGTQQDFPIVENGKVVGILTRAQLIEGLTKFGPDASVSNVMQRDFITLEPTEMLETAFAKLQSCECRTVPVVMKGRLVGIVTPDNVGEFLMIQSALSHRPAPAFPQWGPQE
ncbi:MAG: site-2 protease family protein [Candidatus Sumerlaeaceae bacterium]